MTRRRSPKTLEKPVFFQILTKAKSSCYNIVIKHGAWLISTNAGEITGYGTGLSLQWNEMASKGAEV
jgi:hypothetical protein